MSMCSKLYPNGSPLSPLLSFYLFSFISSSLASAPPPYSYLHRNGQHNKRTYTKRIRCYMAGHRMEGTLYPHNFIPAIRFRYYTMLCACYRYMRLQVEAENGKGDLWAELWGWGWSTGCQLVYDIEVSGHKYILFYHFSIRFSFACVVESLCIRTFVRMLLLSLRMEFLMMQAEWMWVWGME